MQPTKTRYNYTEGGDFLLDGKNYVGYFCVYSDGFAYTGREKTTLSKILTRQKNFSCDYYFSQHFKDLVAYDTPQLPYSMSDIAINMGELVNYTTINTKLRYIHENNLYLYSKLFCADTNVPVIYNKTAAIENNSSLYSWYNTTNFSSFGYSKFASYGTHIENTPYFSREKFTVSTGTGVGEILYNGLRIIKNQCVYSQSGFDAPSDELTISGFGSTNQNITGEVVLLTFNADELVDLSENQHALTAINGILYSSDYPFIPYTVENIRMEVPQGATNPYEFIDIKNFEIEITGLYDANSKLITGNRLLYKIPLATESQQLSVYGDIVEVKNSRPITNTALYSVKLYYNQHVAINNLNPTQDSKFKINDFSFKDEDFTVEWFAKIKSFISTSFSVPNYTVTLVNSYGGDIVFDIKDSNTLVVKKDNQTFEFAVTLRENKWYHFSFTRKNNDIRVFVDGKLVGSVALSYHRDIDNMKRFIIMPFTNNNGFGILGITDTYMMGMTSNKELTNISLPLFYSNVIDNESDEQCQSLEDIIFNGKHVFITDSKINGGGQVFKYDATTFFTGDYAYQGKRFLIRPIGGVGVQKDNNKFNACSIMGATNELLAVYDSGNNAIKLFTNNFVWVRTIILPRAKYQIRDIKFRDVDGYMYVLFSDGVNNGMIIYNNEFRLLKIVRYTDDLYEKTDKIYKRMLISQQDSNVFYLVTKSSVHKKFFSNPSRSFATFKRNKIGQSPILKWNFEDINWSKNKKIFNLQNKLKSLEFSDIALYPGENNYDDLFLLADGVILHFNESTIYNSNLRHPQMQYYTYNDIKLDMSEYVQSLSLNKELLKIISNLNQIKMHLKGKFHMLFDKYGDLIFNEYLYIKDEQYNVLDVTHIYNFRVNDNELMQAGVLNRVFAKIYQVQQLFIDATQPEITNFRHVLTNQNVLIID